MAKEVQRPYGRSQFNRALVTNALVEPFNVVVLAGMLVAGLLLNVFSLMLPVALVVYGVAAARTYFDHDVADRVLAREREQRRTALERGRLDPSDMAAPIRTLLEAALQRERRIRDAIDRADLPYTEVSDEVDGFVRTLEQTATRAQLLHEGLEESPPDAIERRLGEVEGDPSRAELAEALRQQLAVQRRMETQLQRFYDEMERTLVELDTVRGSLISVSATTEAANQKQLASDVRELREEMGAVAAGMDEAYGEPASG